MTLLVAEGEEALLLLEGLVLTLLVAEGEEALLLLLEALTLLVAEGEEALPCWRAWF